MIYLLAHDKLFLQLFLIIGACQAQLCQDTLSGHTELVRPLHTYQPYLKLLAEKITVPHRSFTPTGDNVTPPRHWFHTDDKRG